MEEAQSTELMHWIKKRILNHPQQSISFRDFMDACLYHPTWGYYVSDREKIGREGDFYTSAYIGDWMGSILATFIAKQECIQSGESWCLAEWGGGTGRLAKQLMNTLKLHHSELYERVTLYLVEYSPKHRQVQLAALKDHAGKIVPLTAEKWNETTFSQPLIVYSNELLDAFPVYRVKQEQGVLREIRVGWNEQTASFQDITGSILSSELLTYLQQAPLRLHDGQEAEINMAAEQWIGQMGRVMSNGCMITIDYGDVAEELYAEHRMQGTLMCYFRHTAADNPYTRIGMQDMTAHVNFTACMRAGEAAGFATQSFQSQKSFLVEHGILNYLQEHHSPDPFSPQAKQNRSIRQLLVGDSMGELFKVLVQCK